MKEEGSLPPAFPARTKKRVLFVAPFERDLEFGGSQRATTIAEALEARGFETQWWTAPFTRGSITERLRRLASALPDLAYQYGARIPSGPWDIVIAEHSYLARCFESATPNAVRVVDFHNLEWEHLRDVAATLAPPKRWFFRLQAHKMAAFEASLVRDASICCFTGEKDLRRSGAKRGAVVIPNRLPCSTTASASRIYGIRQAHPGLPEAPSLVYVGKLDFRPNFIALKGFVEHIWPRILAVHPGALLVVAGKLPPGPEGLLAGPGIEALGYVQDLEPILAACSAAVLPLTMRGGTSLRVLYYAIAGVPMIGTLDAFRGFDPPPGLVAREPGEWIDAVGACMRAGADVADLVEMARNRALEINSDNKPFDRLVDLILGAMP